MIKKQSTKMVPLNPNGACIFPLFNTIYLEKTFTADFFLLKIIVLTESFKLNWGVRVRVSRTNHDAFRPYLRISSASFDFVTIRNNRKITNKLHNLLAERYDDVKNR
jgi:hypothetical protein